MTGKCYRCKETIGWPITVETKEPDGRVRWRVTLCPRCHDDWADSFEEEKA